jgi:hypothetical protein
LPAGIDPDGFFVVDIGTEPPTVLFRAKRFMQRALGGDVVEFTSENDTVQLPLFLVGSVLPVIPGSVGHSDPSQQPEGWGHWLGSLRRLCAASLPPGTR